MDFQYKIGLEALDELAEHVRSFGAAHQLSNEVTFDLHLCLDEVITNIIIHGYGGKSAEVISLSLYIRDNQVRAMVVDQGPAFDPLTEAPEPKLDAPLEEREMGGLGIFLCKKMMDRLEYSRHDNKNVLTMHKNCT